MKHGKKYEEAKKLVDKSKAYPLTEAIDLLKKVNYAKFDAGIEIAIKTNANPKYNDQMLRATTILPHGTGKTKKVAVFVSDDKIAPLSSYRTPTNPTSPGGVDFFYPNLPQLTPTNA